MAITLALALLVCPERVRWLEDEFTTCVQFDEIRVELNDNFVHVADTNLFSKVEGGRRLIVQYPNLARTYEDHGRAVRAKRLIERLLPLAVDRTCKAAVLGIAWAVLQSKHVAESALIEGQGDESGFWYEVNELGVSIQTEFRPQKFIRASYPTLKSFYDSKNTDNLRSEPLGLSAK